MIFTSGTSGDPKAVRFAHAMAVMCGTSLVDRFELTSDDVCYLSMPLFHSNGVAAGWAVAIACGATMVAAKFSPSRFLSDIRRYRPKYMNYVGKPLALVLATPEQPDDADNTLRAAFGNESTERDIDEVARRFGCRVVDSFGSSEFAVVVMREDRRVRRTRRARRRPVMAAIVLNEAVALSPKRFEEFLASQPDLSPKAWPRYVRINAALPQTATSKILKRTLIAEGVSAGDGVVGARGTGAQLCRRERMMLVAHL